jgi:ABC-type nickel/cobalt efflux system permease component RcnA
MNSKRNGLGLILAGLALLTFAGCPQAANNVNKTAKSGDAHDHDHDHGHEHVHSGPHKGHLMEIGGEEYHAEWTHDESGKVTFYILDSDAKKEVPIAAEEITIDVKVGDNPPKEYKLTAVTPQDGKSAAFEIVDKEFEGLFDQLKSSSIVLTLHVNINGKQFDEQVKEHEHH